MPFSLSFASRMTRVDLRNYLESIYNVPVAAVRTRVQYGECPQEVLLLVLCPSVPHAHLAEPQPQPLLGGLGLTWLMETEAQGDLSGSHGAYMPEQGLEFNWAGLASTLSPDSEVGLRWLRLGSKALSIP